MTVLTPWWNVLACSELCIHFPFLNPSSPYLTSMTTLKQLTALIFFPCSSSLFWLFQWLFLEESPPHCSFPYSFGIVMAHCWIIFCLVFLGGPICPRDFICCCSKAVFCPISLVLPVCLATPWVKYGQN